MAKKTILVLEDGSIYEGHSFGAEADAYGEVVFNTITGGHIPLRDGFQIRRAAVEKRIPCFTSLDTFRAAVEALANDSQTYSVQPLPEYRRKEAT